MTGMEAPARELRAGALSVDQVRALYRERMTADFPPIELKPLSMIEDALASGRYACYEAFRGADILAYAYVIKKERLALLDYYAVRRDVREQGVGSAFLQALMGGAMQSMECALLEVEDPTRSRDSEEQARRERRLRFYLRNGLMDTGVRTAVFGVPYRVLSLPVGSAPSRKDVKRVYGLLYRTILPPKMYEAQVRICL